MSVKMEQLRSLLQVIALPVTGQMRLFKDDCCRLERLAGALRTWRNELPPELEEMLTPEQERLLMQLGREMAHACRESESPMWTDRAMRQSDRWRQARWLAREALVTFGWLLELPAQEFLYSLPVASRS